MHPDLVLKYFCSLCFKGDGPNIPKNLWLENINNPKRVFFPKVYYLVFGKRIGWIWNGLDGQKDWLDGEDNKNFRNSTEPI